MLALRLMSLCVREDGAAEPSLGSLIGCLTTTLASRPFTAARLSALIHLAADSAGVASVLMLATAAPDDIRQESLRQVRSFEVSEFRGEFGECLAQFVAISTELWGISGSWRSNTARTGCARRSAPPRYESSFATITD